MKQTLFFFWVLILCGSIGFAQNYSTPALEIGTDASFDYAMSSTSLIANPNNDVLSTWQTLPFPFEYFGTAVTGYFASDNGYITFDNTATVSEPSNTVIPSATAPLNAIFAFWDDLNVANNPSGTPDAVVRSTYGETGNRVHVIQWFSVTPNAGTGFLYASVRLYECGDFDVTQHYGNTSGTSATVGCQNSDGTIGSLVLGSPSLPYAGGAGDPGNADDVVYKFYYNGIEYDVSMESIDFDRLVLTGTPSLTGTVKNLGLQPLTSFEVSYSINSGATQTHTVNSIFVQRGETYNFTHGTPTDFATPGTNYEICVSIGAVNGNADQRACNNDLCEDLFSIQGTSGPKNVLIEEFTGTWCQFCPDGEVIIDQIVGMYPDRVVSVSVHDGASTWPDGMEYNDGIRTGFNVTAYPSANVDRVLFPGEGKVPFSRSGGAWSTRAAQRLNEWTPVNIAMNHTYNPATRQITANVATEYVDYSVGETRVHFLVVEDGVTGTGLEYNQSNFYNTVAGHPYQGAGNPIVGYVHKRVLRANPFGVWGTNPGIPMAVSPGGTYSQPVVFTLDPSWDETQISVIAFVSLYDAANIGGNEIIGAVWQTLGDAGTTDIDTDLDGNSIFGVYPNPVSGLGYVHIGFDSKTNATVEIFNAIGQKIETLKQGEFTPGEHKVFFDTSEKPGGVYYVTVTTDGQRLTEKIIVAK